MFTSLSDANCSPLYGVRSSYSVLCRFHCDNCLKKKNEKRKENKYNAKRLPTTKLGNYIENRVNNFLKKKEAGAGEVTVRVVSSSEKLVDVKPGMKTR